jgi:hypothetical protein
LKRVSEEGILYGYDPDRGAAETNQKLAEALARVAERQPYQNGLPDLEEYARCIAGFIQKHGDRER